jgi:hypothetical protein
MKNQEARNVDSRRIVIIAVLLGAGIHIFMQLAFGIMSDFFGFGGTTAVVEQQCSVLYTIGNAPMYSCEP